MSQYILSIMKGEKKGVLASIIVLILLPFSFLYGTGVFCHRNFYRLKGKFGAHKPLISIGNITVGGAGKTPLVIWLAKNLQSKGLKAVIVTRGYMPDKSYDSDEVDMINEQIPFVPILAGANRAASIAAAKNTLPVDIFICDDAFQHWPLYRDLDMVAIDAQNPFGNGHLLPAGILREPLAALKRAHVIVLTKMIGHNAQTDELFVRIKKINPKALILESCFKSDAVKDVFNGEVLPIGFLKNMPVAGFCAIGDPSSFETELRNAGAHLMKMFIYPDHHVYQRKEIEGMLDFCKQQAVPILAVTHKDAVKLAKFKDYFVGYRVVYLPIQLEITNGTDEFFQKINSICLY